ncbi:hypothetical protein NDU88_003983 [Pleurodeles waltl]|uniref:Uncharacterized protein n=1 Tax=Pleurodeles waltl TaxID=8319 RepID=A0AAV7VIH5_PLEWA|nr:hypothetical protein NDU88_003983 [Pleurodeles waltl]
MHFTSKEQKDNNHKEEGLGLNEQEGLAMGPEQQEDDKLPTGEEFPANIRSSVSSHSLSPEELEHRRTERKFRLQLAKIQMEEKLSLKEKRHALERRCKVLELKSKQT